jgi:hypothetical protein
MITARFYPRTRMTSRPFATGTRLNFHGSRPSSQFESFRKSSKYGRRTTCTTASTSHGHSHRRPSARSRRNVPNQRVAKQISIATNSRRRMQPNRHLAHGDKRGNRKLGCRSESNERKRTWPRNALAVRQRCRPSAEDFSGGLQRTGSVAVATEPVPLLQVTSKQFGCRHFSS